MVDKSLAGFENVSEFTPDQLYAGEADIVTTQGSVPAAQGALTKYAVVSQNTDGEIVAFDGTEAYGVLPHAIPDAAIAQDTPVIIGGVLNFDVLTGHTLSYATLKVAFARSNSNIVIQKLY